MGDATKEWGFLAWGDTEVTLMSCKMIFPKIPLGTSTAPPKPFGPQNCQTPHRAGPRAVLSWSWQGLATIIPGLDLSPLPFPVPCEAQEPSPPQPEMQKQRQHQGDSGLGLLLSRLHSTAHISAG